MKIKKVQVFFAIRIGLSIPQLVTAQQEFCDKNNIRVYTKVTDPEYIKKIDFYFRVNIRIASG